MLPVFCFFFPTNLVTYFVYTNELHWTWTSSVWSSIAPVELHIHASVREGYCGIILLHMHAHVCICMYMHISVCRCTFWTEASLSFIMAILSFSFLIFSCCCSCTKTESQRTELYMSTTCRASVLINAHLLLDPLLWLHRQHFGLRRGVSRVTVYKNK